MNKMNIIFRSHTEILKVGHVTQCEKFYENTKIDAMKHKRYVKGLRQARVTAKFFLWTTVYDKCD